MEAERERGLKETEEEGDDDEAAAEQLGKIGREVEEKAVNGGEGNGGEGNSVLFEEHEGANVINGINGLKLGETNEFVDEENIGNGITNVGASKLNGHLNLKTGVSGNGLNSQLSFEKWSGNRSTRSENEIKEYEQREPEKSNEFIAEYDLERVLDEQETHDVYCPNCKACITKREILRKRKRTHAQHMRSRPHHWGSRARASPGHEGNNINKHVSLIKPTSPKNKPTSPKNTAEINQNVHGLETHADTHIDMGVHGREESRSYNEWDVLKSIVYGGLIELITSLGVVSSAAGSGSTTLNICALGIANLIGGLFVISHDISELRSAHDAEAANRMEAGRYWEKLGKREHFRRRVIFAVLSYIVFGLLPPVIYGFTFRESDNKEYKIIAAAASSLFCVALLAIGKAHVRQKDYIKSLFYYLGLAMPASGLSYVAGIMVNRLFVELGLFDATAASPSPPSSGDLFRFGSGGSSWALL